MPSQAIPPSTVVDKMPPKGRRKYPWDEWFDGRTHMLTKGEHFHCKPETMAHAARDAGRRRKLDVDASYNFETGNVWIRMMGPLDAAEPRV